MKNFITKYPVPLILLLMIILGNAWSLSENDRLLKPITNFFFIFLAIINVIKTNTNGKQRT
jgi:hypothetical protein